MTTRAVTKPKKKAPKRPSKRLPETTVELARCVLWALKFLRSTGMHFNAKARKARPWEEVFMDALDGIGYRIDRPAFWKQRDGKRRGGAAAARSPR